MWYITGIFWHISDHLRSTRVWTFVLVIMRSGATCSYVVPGGCLWARHSILIAESFWNPVPPRMYKTWHKLSINQCRISVPDHRLRMRWKKLLQAHRRWYLYSISQNANKNRTIKTGWLSGCYYHVPALFSTWLRVPTGCQFRFQPFKANLYISALCKEGHLGCKPITCQLRMSLYNLHLYLAHVGRAMNSRTVRTHAVQGVE